MNTDSFFTIGSTHKVCQDYAIALNDTKNGPFIALSDGCSASPDTDFGSRILVKSIQNLYCNEGVSAMSLDDNKLTELIWNKAFNSINAISGLSPYCLDATLLFAYKSNNKIEVVMMGDGTVSLKAKDGTLFTKTIEYKGNAPLYLSYLHSNPSRREQREVQFDCKKVITNTIHKTGKGVLNWSEQVSTNDIERFSFFIEDFDYISLFSDGVTSFTSQEISDGTKTNELVPEHLVIEQAMNFKNYAGEFVRRRCNRFLKEWSDIESKASDDFSTATIYTGT